MRNLLVVTTHKLGFTIGAQVVDGVKHIVVEHVEAGSAARGVQGGDWIVRVDASPAAGRRPIQWVEGTAELAGIVAALESQKRPLRVALQRPSAEGGAARKMRSWRCCGGCFVIETPPLLSASSRAGPAPSGGTAASSGGAAPARRGRRRKPRSKTAAKAGLAVAFFGIVLAAIWPWLTEAEGGRDVRVASLGDCPNIFVRVRTSVEGLLAGGAGGAGDAGGAGGAGTAAARALLERGAMLLMALFATDAPPPSPAALRVGAVAQIALVLWTVAWTRRVAGHLWRLTAVDAEKTAAAAAAAASAQRGGDGASAGAVGARGVATGDVDGAWDAAILAALLPGPFVVGSSAAMSFALETNGGAPLPTASALALAAALGCAALSLAAAQHVGRCDADAHAARAAPRAQQTLAALLLSGGLCFASLCVALETQLPWGATLRRA